MSEPDPASPLIGIVGPCGAGKSTLAAALAKLGYTVRHIAQEHSYVPYMWQRIANPDVLILLTASFETCTRRRNLSWNRLDHAEQLRRLEHARMHADLIVDTDDIPADEVLSRVLTFLRER